MKYLFLALILTLPLTATAQQRRGDERRSGDRGADERRTPSSTARPPSIPPNQSPWWERRNVPWWEGGPKTQSMNPARDMLDKMREDRQRREHGAPAYRDRRRNSGGAIYFVPQPYPVEQTITVVAPVEPRAIVRSSAPLPAPIGFLNLEVEPRALLQIFVDDVFVGTPADQGDELRLTPGTRRIELRAKGYKPLSFSAEILADRSISYRGALERDPGAAVAPDSIHPTPSVPTTMYKIQGCYLGNVMPKQVDLRPGCDIGNLVTFKP